MEKGRGEFSNSEGNTTMRTDENYYKCHFKEGKLF
jgi:hypothetical protein